MLKTLPRSLYTLPRSFLPNRVAMEWVRGMQSLVRMVLGADAMRTLITLQYLACFSWRMEPVHPISWILLSKLGVEAKKTQIFQFAPARISGLIARIAEPHCIAHVGRAGQLGEFPWRKLRFEHQNRFPQLLQLEAWFHRSTGAHDALVSSTHIHLILAGQR